MVLGNEPVFAGDDVISRVTSGGVGYAVRTSLAFASLGSEHAATGTPLSVEVFGERVPASVVDDPVFDPSGERIRS
jgi:glycine cleavage system aminomethyltransferase T